MPLVDPAREAEWNRRRRADRDGIPMPPEFRIFDDPESITLRFPVAIGPQILMRVLPDPQGGTSGRRAAAILILCVTVVAFCGKAAVLLLSLLLVISVVALPLAILGLVRRTVTVRPEGVEIGWWPVPFLARRLVHRGISQAFVVRQFAGMASVLRNPLSRGVDLDFLPGSPDTAALDRFDLWIVRPDGSRELLVGNLRSAEHAFFLERWLERRLGIPDAPVAGEVW